MSAERPFGFLAIAGQVCHIRQYIMRKDGQIRSAGCQDIPMKPAQKQQITHQRVRALPVSFCPLPCS